LASDSGFLVRHSRGAEPFEHVLEFVGSDGIALGKARLTRGRGTSAAISDFQLPKFRVQGKGDVSAEKWLSAIVEELGSKAETLGYSSISFAPFQRWPKGNRVLEAAGFRARDGSTELSRELSWKSRALSIQEKSEKAAHFRLLADAFERSRPRIESVLNRINTPEGTRYEIELVRDMLKNVENIELHQLQNSRILDNVAVYASTNAPLYTLAVHALVPGSISRNVWFRTPERTRSVYSELFEVLAEGLPPGTLNGIHILTENADTQYDLFRNQYVIGTNKKGKQVRPPSEVVIFTGSPATAQTILGQILGKFRQLPGQQQEYK
jgi:hypothetical protein